MSSDRTNSDNEKSSQDDSQRRRPPFASPGLGNRRRGGVGVDLPDDDDDVQPCSFAESHPGGGIFRAMALQSREPVLQRADNESGSISKPAPIPVQSNPTLMKFDSSSRTKAASHEEWTPLPKVEDVPYIEWIKGAVVIQLLPMFFPKSNLNFEFPTSELEDVLSRLAKVSRKLSIQVKFRDSPLSAFLQTCENVEFYLVFFHEKVTRRYPTSMDPNTRKVFMSVQRHRGDQMVANRYLHELIDAAKGVGIEEECGTDRGLHEHRGTPNAEQIMQVERMIVRACESPEGSSVKDLPSQFVARQTPTDMIVSSFRQLYSWIQQPKRLENRQHALEYLVFMTDVKRTMSSSAIAGALLVLQGTAPGMSKEAKEIQHFFLTILQHRALPGDRIMFEGMNLPPTDEDRDIVMQPYFPEESEETQGYHTFIIEYFNKLFHLALQVLVQALEVVECFQKQIVADGANICEMASNFLFVASENGDGKELRLTLLECIRRAESKLANAYLACKALRLLSLAYPPMKESLKLDDNARLSIKNAYNIGMTSHALLRDESFQLWEVVRQDGV